MLIMTRVVFSCLFQALFSLSRGLSSGELFSRCELFGLGIVEMDNLHVVPSIGRLLDQDSQFTPEHVKDGEIQHRTRFGSLNSRVIRRMMMIEQGQAQAEDQHRNSQTDAAAEQKCRNVQSQRCSLELSRMVEHVCGVFFFNCEIWSWSQRALKTKRSGDEDDETFLQVQEKRRGSMGRPHTEQEHHTGLYYLKSFPKVCGRLWDRRIKPSRTTTWRSRSRTCYERIWYQRERGERMQWE